MAKQKSQQVAASPAKIKTAVNFTPRAFRRLGAACVYYDRNQSDLLEELVNEKFGSFRVVCDQAKSVAPAMPISSAITEHGLDSPVAISA